MINYNPKSWLTLIFALHKSDTLRILWKEIIYMAVFTLLVAYIELTFFPHAENLEKLIAVYSLTGFVISLLLVFRTNTAYDRWWEGRKKWGEVVNDSRNLALKSATLFAQEQDRLFMARMIANFAYAMKEHLRNGVLFEELELSENEVFHLQKQTHVPLAICKLMYQKLKEGKENKQISEEEYLAMDRNLNALMDSCGACERIKKTPIPFSYSLFFKKFISVYVITMPLAFVGTFGYWSALIATFVFYVLVSIEVLAEEIEDPFGSDANDLPTDDIAIQIRTLTKELCS
jgi:putative membrane protein